MGEDKGDHDLLVETHACVHHMSEKLNTHLDNHRAAYNIIGAALATGAVMLLVAIMV